MALKTVKKRNWCAVVYPESLPADWIDILRRSGLKGAISPLHNQDYNPDKTLKKPHYHVMLIYGSPTTYNNVCTFVKDKLHGTIPQPIEQVVGMYRYFTHKDNPEKAQYNEKDIVNFGGFSIFDYIELSKNEEHLLKENIINLIINSNILEYCDLIDYLLKSDQSMFEFASNHTIFFDRYISSKRHKNEKEKQKKDSLG